MGRKFQNILETVGNTPVVKINRLAPQGVNLFVKIEAFNPLGSVKDRLALGVIETFGARYISSNFRDAYAFIVMIAVLVAWPRGLFGEKSSEKV